jgi:hypothetical protein
MQRIVRFKRRQNMADNPQFSARVPPAAEQEWQQQPFLYVRLVVASRNTWVVFPAEVLQEDRVVNSNGTNRYDRFKLHVGGLQIWVERSDLCQENGELIQWMPYEKRS